jgi:two-component system autoinducer 2 sensor kinase/phosphatase LuxQ
MEKELVGFVFLGQKINMQPYTNDDIEIFQILANQAGLAIENCIFMQEFKQAQEKIFSAEKLASIGGMADGIAHQIKNRLNHFSVAAGELKMELEYINSKKPILQKDKDIKKSMDYVTQIAKSLLDNVKRTDQTVKGVLNYARTSEKDNFFTVFSLSEIIKLSTDLLKVKHHLKQAPLDERIKVDEIYGIKAQIMEVVYNLMDNSYEAILEKKEVLGKEKAKGYKPQIKIAATENTKNYILTFSDNGIGVKDEDQLKIFAPFFTTKTSYKQTQSGKSGTGIGMYIVKRLIEEAHHGHIWFESQYLQGTTFHIFLPKKKT